MDIPKAFLDARYALLHGDDAEGRMRAISEWKARHVDPEWEDFSLIVCPEGCQWPVVQSALLEAAPFGADRVVIVPQADNLLERAKELPPAVKTFLSKPLEGTRLLLVARNALSAAPGKILGAKPFSDWNKEGRALKVGDLDSKAAVEFLESKAREFKLKLDAGVAHNLAGRLGGNPGVLTRALEVLELIAEGRVTHAMIDQSTFRMGEQNAFAWSQAWQSGQIGEAIKTLRVAIEDEPDSAPLMLLAQARREVERLCRLHEARKQGVNSTQELASALGLTPKQTFLLDRYSKVLERIRPEGLKKLAALIVDADSDIKGGALSQSAAPLTNLTLVLCRAWGG
ncbi:MAG: DNA polymerase III subunit delta [Holophagales bacterium]|jgi:DNA polymerase III delta subunit|nr:DNA polymerase III subunit delta [Holophagales bacterium]